MTNAAGVPSQEKPYRMPAPLKVFTACVICLSIGFISFSVNDIATCRSAREQTKAKLTELKQAKLAGTANDAELAAVDASFKQLCSRCGA